MKEQGFREHYPEVRRLLHSVGKSRPKLTTISFGYMAYYRCTSSNYFFEVIRGQESVLWMEQFKGVLGGVYPVQHFARWGATSMYM